MPSTVVRSARHFNGASCCSSVPLISIPFPFLYMRNNLGFYLYFKIIMKEVIQIDMQRFPLWTFGSDAKSEPSVRHFGLTVLVLGWELFVDLLLFPQAIAFVQSKSRVWYSSVHFAEIKLLDQDPIPSTLRKCVSQCAPQIQNAWIFIQAVSILARPRISWNCGFIMGGVFASHSENIRGTALFGSFLCHVL